MKLGGLTLARVTAPKTKLPDTTAMIYKGGLFVIQKSKPMGYTNEVISPVKSLSRRLRHHLVRCRIILAIIWMRMMPLCLRLRGVGRSHGLLNLCGGKAFRLEELYALGERGRLTLRLFVNVSESSNQKCYLRVSQESNCISQKFCALWRCHCDCCCAANARADAIRIRRM